MMWAPKKGIDWLIGSRKKTHHASIAIDQILMSQKGLSVADPFGEKLEMEALQSEEG